MQPVRSADGATIAVLYVLDLQARKTTISKAAAQALDILAEHIGLTLDLAGSVADHERLLVEQQAVADQLSWAAHHDPLTGLPNRMQFEAELKELTSQSAGSDKAGALLLVDIDHFKQINEAIGHVGGDHVLQHYSQRLRSLTQRADLVARIGGDEFAVLCPAIGDRLSAIRLTEKVAEGMRLPIAYGGRTVDGRSSIGLALCPEHGADVEHLIKAADLVLQTAKRAGRDRFTVFDPEFAVQARHHDAVLAAARAAIDDGRLTVHYQPKYRLSDGEIQGLEALLRWVLLDGGLVMPNVWAEVFTEPDLAAAISERVLERVSRDAADWLSRGLVFGHVAINTGALDFTRGTFSEQLLTTMALFELPPEAIQIEVTETVLLGRSNGQVQRDLKMLPEYGIRIALDDFGTGYASLTHLKHYPIDILKIDGSFVAGLGSNAEDVAIVKSVIALANDLGIQSVAEGIETVAQAEFLKAHGCDMGQGFLFSEALPANQVGVLLSATERRS